MVRLAMAQKKMGLFAGLIIQLGGEMAILGGGDVVLPLLFAGVVGQTNMALGYFIIYGAVIGLAALLLLGKRKKAYPAMPILSLGMIVSYLIGLSLF